MPKTEEMSRAAAYCNRVGGSTPLDRWISFAVKVLRDAGVETYESCQGGEDHAFLEPTIRFHGDSAEGFRAYAAAIAFGLPVYSVRRAWDVVHGELTGPKWEMTFYPRSKLMEIQREAELAGLMKVGAPSNRGPARRLRT